MPKKHLDAALAGAGLNGLLSTAVFSLVSPTAQIVGTIAVFANRELSPRLLPPVLGKFGQHSSNYTKWGKICKLRFNQHREKAFT